MIRFCVAVGTLDSFWWFTVTNLSMDSLEKKSLTTQALDMFFGDEAIQSRIVKPLKRRAVPFVIGSLLVNLLLVALLVYLVLRVECLSRFVRGMQAETV